MNVEIGIATWRDLDGIVALQAMNQISNGGSLSAFLPRARLLKMMEELPQIVARKEGEVVGFLLCSAMCADVPILQAMLDAYPMRTENAYAYGPICVARNERGRGIAQAMFAMLKRMHPGREGILFIRSDNEPSLRAHRKMGMREVSSFLHAGVEHVVLNYTG